MTTFDLLIGYINTHGVIITQSIPGFDTMSDCEYWRVYLSEMLEKFNGADVQLSSCTIKYWISKY